MTDGVLFARLAWWPALLAVPVVWFALRSLDAARVRRLARVVGPRSAALAPDRSETLGRVRRALFAEAILLAVVAALHPVWGDDATADNRRSDVVVCLDVSRSMLARDVAPDRLERARREIQALAERSRGDRLALVVFAGEARIDVPLTLDTASFAEMASRAGTLSVRRGGTDLGAALTTALRVLERASSPHGAIVLLTDGEDRGERGLAAAADCHERGVAVHCVGFGSTRGSKIAIRADDGDSARPTQRETFLRDASGADVVTAMDPESLRRIADATGGTFIDAGSTPDALTTLYAEHLLPNAQRSLEASERNRREDRYQVPLLGAFLLLVFDLCLTDRRRS